ncbi:MAG TPA: S41 family peptidase [Gammaproteobacteria bacterium]|nr:S41 family peptidase [Gammaproteobacteria bacterium]
MHRLIVFVVTLTAAAAAWAQPGRGYYRYPALHGTTIVFAAEGDLWTVPVAGGVARRLTTHPGEESHPAISPDGKTVAFTATYEGPAELYTMPLAGGLPARLTFDADESTSLGWTRDGRILYTTNHYSTLPDLQLVALDPRDGARERIPLSQASEASFDASGKSLFFVRPAFHRNVTKRYTGGTARKIWRYDQGAPDAVPLTAGYDGESHTPMAWNGRVYFITDRDGTMNLWSMRADGADPRQHTRHRSADARDASLSDDGRIVYQVGADLWLYDIASGADALVPIELASDFDQLRDRWVSDPWQQSSAVHLHPRGESVALTVRGRVFVAPAKAGRLTRVSQQEGVRYRDATFLGDGARLVGFGDATGELELTTLPANGVGAPQALTTGGDATRLRVYPSPDGKQIAFTDTNNDLWLLDLGSRQRSRVSTGRDGVGDVTWSPDNRFLAYSEVAANTFAQVFLYEAAARTRVTATSERVNSGSPAFSRDGKFLYFLSDRDLRSVVSGPWGPRQPEPYFDTPIKVYELALRDGLRSPFRPDDELFRAPEKKEDGAEEKADGKDAKADKGRKADKDGKAGEGAAKATSSADAVTVVVDARDIQRRLREVPAGSGNYSALAVSGDALFWLARDPGREGKLRLQGLPIKNRDAKVVTLVEAVDYFELSQDGKKLLVQKDKKVYVVDAAAKALEKLDESEVSLAGFGYPMNVRDDWREIFLDAWRLERDYFYDPAMHGVDWRAARDKYLPLVDRVTTREELSDVIGQFVGELTALHTSVRGGDLRTGRDNVVVASLGARLERRTDGYLIEHIYRSDPDYPSEVSPLADTELGIGEGDVIEAVNGVATVSVPDIGELLRNQVDRQVLLRVRSSGAREPRDVVVTPMANEASLRYADWEYSRRLAVDEKSTGKIGYVHLRAMGGDDVTAWYRQFYPVFDRQGIIIDVRHNRGGNIDSFILEKLSRRAWFYWQPRVGSTSWNMQYAFRGHMVVLVDANTASDGEAFAEGFKRLGLGPVIGTRTWGGEIWLDDSLTTLSDGGVTRTPQLGVFGPERKWLVENHGVEPDIVVDNPPRATFGGTDAQLEAALAYLREQIAKDPRPVPAPPPYPNHAFDNGPSTPSGSAP